MKKPNDYTEPELVEIWDKNLTGWGSRSFFKPIIPQLCRFIFANKLSGSVLDLGCGNGNKTVIFSEMGFEVKGFDNDSERISKARLKFPNIDFETFKIESKLPFEDDSFDIIFSCSVFQYIEHKLVLDECRRILKKDGCFIMIENLKDNPFTKSARAIYKLTKHDYQSYPWNHFTYSEIGGLKECFANSEVFFFHVVSPLANLKFFSSMYYLFSKMDKFILRYRFFRKFSWIVLFMGKNN